MIALGNMRFGTRIFVICWLIAKISSGEDNFVDSLTTLGVGTVNLIVGFSTGHVGTATLSSEASYQMTPGSPPTVFVFESAIVNKSEYEDPKFDKEREIQHVQQVYGPFLVDQIKSKIEGTKAKTVNVIDMSHSNLFFYRGLAEVIRNQPMINLHFVRVHRDRAETAIDMNSPSSQQSELTYSPLENTPNVILTVDAATWANMTKNERNFWFIDEVEARWARLLEQYPDTKHSEVLWGERWPGSLGDVVHEVAKLAGIASAHEAASGKRHSGAKMDILQMDCLDDERSYQRKMGYDYIPG